MAKSKPVNFDFWRVETPKSYTGGFAAGLRQLAQITNLTARNAVIGGYTMRWEELDVTGRYYFGDFLKLRMDILPLKGGVGAKSSSLNLAKNEGISELFAFLFDTNSSVLVTQHNHYGASVAALTEYAQQKIDFGGLLSFNPVVTVSGMQKLNGLTDIRRVVYRVAKPTTRLLNPNIQGSVDSAVEMLDDCDASSVEVAISSGHLKRSLTLREIFQRVRNLMTGHSTAGTVVEKVEIAGYVDEEREEFDLIQERLRAKIPLPIGNNREILYSARRSAAMDALNKRRDELVQLFGAPCR